MKGLSRLLSTRCKSLTSQSSFHCSSKPALRFDSYFLRPRCSSFPRTQLRSLHVEHLDRQPENAVSLSPDSHLLPWCCPGCGAYTQPHNANEAGFYSLSRRHVRTFIARQKEKSSASDVAALGPSNQSDLESGTMPATKEDEDRQNPAPICDRCHNLKNHNIGRSIIHPTLQSIRTIIEESPYKYNHIYHVLDAADFPLSLIPNIHDELGITPQRSQNRRSKTEKYFGNQNTDISFIITRSDLFAPRKEQVDTLMPRLVETLREALGPAGEGVRLGNVKCVSAHRGWWTKSLKEDIWKNGGGCWMVGKVNVGKSSLFDGIFPKARSKGASDTELPISTLQEGSDGTALISGNHGDPSSITVLSDSAGGEDSLEDNNLLPPRPAESDYPSMPLISHLPGTTASPIRLPFGAGKGELVDLPGLSRGNIEDHVMDEHRSSLVMQHRIKAQQHSIKPGQSFLVSNLVRIEPQTPDVVFLACAFVPLECHVSNTEKAKSVLAHENHTAVACVTNSGAALLTASAGTFALRNNVTRERSGPVTARDAGKVKPAQLPYVILATDILIEGVGWIELAAQVRRRTLEAHGDGWYPTVEVFSPGGRHVGQRPTLGAWLLGGLQKLPVSRRKPGARPKKSMKGVKKAMKRAARAESAGQAGGGGGGGGG